MCHRDRQERMLYAKTHTRISILEPESTHVCINEYLWARVRTCASACRPDWMSGKKATGHSKRRAWMPASSASPPSILALSLGPPPGRLRMLCFPGPPQKCTSSGSSGYQRHRPPPHRANHEIESHRYGRLPAGATATIDPPSPFAIHPQGQNHDGDTDPANNSGNKEKPPPNPQVQ